MSTATANTEANVSAGKGVEGGYCFRAPVGTPLPTSPDWTPVLTDSYVQTSDSTADSSKTYYTRSGSGTESSPYTYTEVSSPSASSLSSYYELVPAAWECMGFITEDGVSFQTESESTDFLDMNGDVMDTSQTSYGESFSCSFAEVKAATFESVYGADAVTDENGVLTVHHTGAEPGYFTYAFLFSLKNGRRWVRYAEKCKRTALEDVTASSSNVLAWNATYKAVKGDGGDYFTDLFESTETAA